MDGVATGIEPEIIAGDLPAHAELVENGSRGESASYQLTQSLLDRVPLRLETGERQFRRECSGKAAHPAGDVECRGARDRVRVARGQEQGRSDPHGTADPGGVETQQPGSCGGSREQRNLAILMRQRPRGEPAGKPARDVVTEEEGHQYLAAGTSRVLADR